MPLQAMLFLWVSIFAMRVRVMWLAVVSHVCDPWVCLLFHVICTLCACNSIVTTKVTEVVSTSCVTLGDV